MPDVQTITQELTDKLRQNQQREAREAEAVGARPRVQVQHPDPAAAQAEAERAARMMQIDEAALRQLAATNDCRAGEQCGRMGFVRFDLPQGHPCFGRVFPCGCRAAEIEVRKIERMFDDAEVPLIYRELSFETFAKLPLKHKTEALHAARRFADVTASTEFRGWVLELNGLLKPGLLLYGPVGVGKSGLSVEIVKRWKEARQNVLWVTWGHLVSKIQATYGRQDHDPRVRRGEDQAMTRCELVEAVQTVRLLVLDDFGDMERSSATNDRRDIAFEVIDYRQSLDLPTVITTNLAPAPNRAGIPDIDGYWGARIARRLRRLCHVVGVGGVEIERWAEQQVKRGQVA